MPEPKGRPTSSNRLFTDQCAILEAAKLPRPLPLFYPNRLPTWDVTATWADGETTISQIELVTTRPHLGGERPWFVCPNCDRRVGKLYGRPELKGFACRICLKLVYYSQYRKGPSWALARVLRRHIAENYARNLAG